MTEFHITLTNGESFTVRADSFTTAAQTARDMFALSGPGHIQHVQLVPEGVTS